MSWLASSGDRSSYDNIINNELLTTSKNLELQLQEAKDYSAEINWLFYSDTESKMVTDTAIKPETNSLSEPSLDIHPKNLAALPAATL